LEVAVATPRQRSELPDPELKLLYADSGNECAFPGCGLVLASEDAASGEAMNVGMAAHIVASSRQGPRGGTPIEEEERDRRASNRILLCPTHHAIVDKQPWAYTVEVLRQMKADHLKNHKRSVPIRVRLASVDSPERLHSSLLPVVGLPTHVESASVRDGSMSEGQIAAQLRYPKGSRGIVFPFIVREGRLWTFSRLDHMQHPFKSVIEADVEQVDLLDLASTEEGHRRVMALLNRALGRHLGMRGVRFDREHQRYWFMADRDDAGEIVERAYTYETKTGRRLTRPVVHHAHRRSGEAKDEWWHEAARLRFERFGPSWFLTVRPEFHLTIDGTDPMPSHRIGRRITRKKSHLYNDGYLDRLWFWKHFLSDGGPRLTIKTGEQSILVEASYATTEVHWPGVPEDAIDVKTAAVEENLFTIGDFLDDDSDDDWSDDGGGDD
jgi:hypothetical protein